MNLYFSIYLSFLKLGAITFGGGLAMLPLLRQEVVERHAWVSEEELIDMYAVAQCAPGIIAVNTSAYVGYRIAGFGGVLTAVLGQITSPVCVITCIASMFQYLTASAVFQHALAGISVMVCVLLTNAVWMMSKKSLLDKFTLGVCIIAFVFCLMCNIPVITLTLCSGGLAILWALLSRKWHI